MRIVVIACSMLMAGVGSMGCAHTHAAEGAPDPIAGSGPDGGTRPPEAVGGEERGACTDVRVHFAYNSSEIPSDERGPLTRAASCLRASPATKVSIEGHTDERGTDEYNVALGDRRAQTVARYLEKLGARTAQVKTITWGKDNPLCTEHQEGCWSRNRRASMRAEGK